jgi:hypothetical protein
MFGVISAQALRSKYSFLLALTMLSGCASVAPHFDVPVNAGGYPSTKAIVERIECELVDLVRNDSEKPYVHRELLLTEDYETAMSLTLDVNDTGGLAPAVSFPFGVISYTVTGNLNQSRDDTVTINLYFSMRELEHEWKEGRLSGVCPVIETNLAGDLGLKRSISAALETHNLNLTTTGVSPSSVSSGGGEFSGSITFTVTKSLTNIGATWTVQHFQGPGGLGTLSEVNTDKLLFGFAEGPNAGKPFNSNIARNRSGKGEGAKNVLNQQVIYDLATQFHIAMPSR